MTDRGQRVDYTASQRKAFGRRLSIEVRGRPKGTRTRLAEAVGLTPGNINNWIATTSAPPAPPVVFALEVQLELEPGTLSRHLGYLPIGASTPPCTVEAALAADDNVDDDTTQIIMAIVRRESAAAH